jgi:hypothetical protein
MYNMNKIHLLVAYYTDNGKVEKWKQQQQTTTSRLINYKVTIYLCTDVLRFYGFLWKVDNLQSTG